MQTMVPIRKLLLKEIRRNPDLQSLADACGESPTRQPPSLSLVAKVRNKVGRLLGLSKKKGTCDTSDITMAI